MRIEDMKNCTVDQLKNEVVRLSEECEKRQHEILDLQEYQIELERDCDVMMMYGEPEGKPVKEIADFAKTHPYEYMRKRLEQYPYWGNKDNGFDRQKI